MVKMKIIVKFPFLNMVLNNLIFFYKERAPFIVYADFDLLLTPIRQTSAMKTIKFQKHIAFFESSYHKCKKGIFSYEYIDSVE